MDAYRASARRASRVLMIYPSTFYYEPHPRDDRAERERIKEIAETRVRYGCERIHTLLRREGWVINHKKTYRIYCEEGLNLRRKRPRRRVAAMHRESRPLASSINEAWSMDFVADELFNGRRIRALTVVDNFSREALAIPVAQRLTGADVVDAVDRLAERRGPPSRIQVDNGSEFISKALDKWAYDNKVELDFSRPGKPTDNAFIESFNGSFRDECLNVNWFLSLDDARQKIEDWHREYNTERPHQSLGGLTPNEYHTKHSQAESLKV